MKTQYDMKKLEAFADTLSEFSAARDHAIADPTKKNADAASTWAKKAMAQLNDMDQITAKTSLTTIYSMPRTFNITTPTST